MILDRLEPDSRRAAVASFTLAAVVGSFGAVFGVGAVAAGASIAQACVMSMLVFTGASQFSAVSVIAAGGTVGSALSSSMLLAARNGVYGLTLAGDLEGPLWRRLIAAHLVLDESTAMATAQPTRHARLTAFWVTGVMVFVFWNIGTLVGALAGSSIDPQRWGLDAAFPAAFVAMVTPHLRTRNGRLAAALGGAICLVTIPFVPIGVSVLCAAAAVLVGVRPE